MTDKFLIKQIQENDGLTDSVHSTLHGQAYSKAAPKAKKEVYDSLSANELKRYKFVETLKMPFLFWIAFPFIALSFCAFKNYHYLALFVGVLVILAKIRNKLKSIFVEPIDQKIKIKTDLYQKDYFSHLKAQRLDYEAFPGTPEWRLRRQEIIENTRLPDGTHVCHICGDKIISSDVTIDHVLPRSKFPHLALEPSNLKPAHRSCNSSKGTKILTASRTKAH